MFSDDPLVDPEGFFTGAPWTLGVIGLGYVGVPLLVAASRAGLPVIGFDISETRVGALAHATSPIDDVSDEDLEGVIASGAEFSTDPALLERADVIAICVPSPLGRNRQPDLSHIVSAVETVERALRPGQLVSLESTTYPGTTDDFLVPAVERKGLRLDTEVWLAFSPERVSPGDPLTTGNIPKIVGGVTPLSTRVAAAAYRRIVPSVHEVSSARSAEMAKLLENTYRAVNIGLINEMAQLASALDIDIWEVIEAADTKPFGFEAFWPGPGVGGHCIPLDPQYLAWRAKEANFATRFIDLAEQVNRQMPVYNANRVAELLNEHGLPVFGAKVLAVGIAYKANIADARESASLQVIDELVRRGAEVSVLDPIVGAEGIAARGLTPIEPDADFSGFALAAVLTDHDQVDYRRIAETVPLVFDARGVYRRLQIEAPNIRPL